MLRFVVRAAAGVELTDVRTFGVIFAENDDGSGGTLELQRALDFDEQDRAFGQDTYCICVNSAATHYGGILDYRLEGDRLFIRLDDSASSKLGLPGGDIELLLQVPPEAIEAACRGIERVIGERQ